MKDIQQEITNKIIESLENGVKPWSCPWVRSGYGGMPQNLKTKMPYNGINVLLLWITGDTKGYKTPFWMTYKQAKELGGTVKKGEQGTRCIFYKTREVEDEKTGEEKAIPMLRAFSVFNLDQVEGISAPDTTNLPGGFDAITRAENFIERTGANIIEIGEAAFYQPSSDTITMPARVRFDTAQDFYATALHELTHWTGHKSRCNRDMGTGKADYAFEELVAEMGAAFTMGALGIEGDTQHESYIASWLKALKNDKKFLFKAAAKASKAAAFLTDLQPKAEELGKAA